MPATLPDPGRAPGTAPAILRLSLGVEPGWVRATLARVDRRAAAWHLTEMQRGHLQIVLAEILNNIDEHAFAQGTRPLLGRYVGLTIRNAADGLHLRITDSGAPMPGGCVPGAAHRPDLGGADLPEGGFGWGLILDLAQEIAYRRHGPLNILTLRMPF